eukprot:5831625-Karenia_brevis.AAC.1
MRPGLSDEQAACSPSKAGGPRSRVQKNLDGGSSSDSGSSSSRSSNSSSSVASSVDVFQWALSK